MTAPRIAIVYDFDGTLSPQPMQEYTVLRQLNIPPADFWNEVREVAAQTRAESMLTYMRLIVEKAEKLDNHLGRNDFRNMAQNIEYFPGVEDWFPRINKFVKKETQGTIAIDHYIVSAGLREILEGINIYPHFRQVYASEYHYDHHGRPTFPKQLITDTTKTQYLFRINKGREDLSDSINEHMPIKERPVPFSHMIFIGDGMTDVPSMAVMRLNHGHAIAVYPPITTTEDGDSNNSPSDSPNAHPIASNAMHKDPTHGMEVCRKLMRADRVDFIAPADYRADQQLEQRVKVLLRSIIADIQYGIELEHCKKENFPD